MSDRLRLTAKPQAVGQFGLQSATNRRRRAALSVALVKYEKSV
jgi:hypothetical protein